MKKWIALFLTFSLCLSGCMLIPPKSTLPPETEAPTPAATQPETEAPTEPPVYYNPLTGVQMREPQTKRIYAVSHQQYPRCHAPHWRVSGGHLHGNVRQ